MSLRSEKNNWAQLAELVLLYVCIYEKIFIPNMSIKIEIGKINSKISFSAHIFYMCIYTYVHIYIYTHLYIYLLTVIVSTSMKLSSPFIDSAPIIMSIS